jgi:plastocyanin
MARRWLALVSLLALVAMQLVGSVGSAAAASGLAPLDTHYGSTSNAAAAASPITILADNPSAVPKGHTWSFNDYFPRTLTVARGTTIQFLVLGFHTATLLPAGMTAQDDLRSGGFLTRDTDDPARNPNGTTKIEVNLAALAPVQPTPGCGTPANPCTFDGTAIVGAGAPQGPGTPEPFVVVVNAPVGTYYFHCRIHAGMIGTLRVVESGSQEVSTPDQLSQAVAAQTAADIAGARAAEQADNHAMITLNKNGTRTVAIHLGGISADGHVSLMEMLPKAVIVHPGDTVRWIVTDTNEPHTITFPNDPHTDLLAFCEHTDGTDTAATPGHVPPQGPGDFTCPSGSRLEVETGGGNGVKAVTSPSTASDSGWISTTNTPTAFGFPANGTLRSWSVSFRGAARGTYHYLCQIHPEMVGTIIVR